jgi:signal transduction histidine kinase/ABC-type nitrate/sulfonate/bicarbonate transport system substrate-binding protein
MQISVRLLWKHQFEFAGFYVAKELGFYEKAGLDVKLKEYEFGIDITKEVQDGKSTFGVGYPSVILDKLNGSDIIFLNAIFQSSPHVLLSLKSSKIYSIKDFKDKTIMIEKDAIQTAPLLSMLYSHHIKLDCVKPVKPSFNIEDLINKKVDISSAYLSNEPYVLDKKGIKYNVFNPADYGFDFYNNILFTSSKFAKEHPRLTAEFQKATIQGWKYAFSHIDETVDIIYSKYNSQHKTKDALEYEARVLKKLALKQNIDFGTLDKTKLQRIADVYNLMGVLKGKASLDNCIFKTTIDDILTDDEKQYLKTHTTIKMCNNPNWEPIEFAINKDTSNMQGIAIDTLKLLEKSLNIKFENIPTKSWSESQQFLKEKKCDILPAAIKTQKRSKYALFTKPYLSYKLAIITNKNIQIIDSLEQLNGKTMSRKKGSGLIQKIKKLYPKIKIRETSGYLESLKLVESGEVDFSIATLPVASYYISKFALYSLHIAGYTNMKYNLSIAIRDDKPILEEILDKGLMLITDKQMKEIHDKWNTVTLQNTAVDYRLIKKVIIIALIIIFLFMYRQYILNKSNKNLEKIVQDKTKELEKANNILKELNENLEQKVIIEVQKNKTIEKQLFESEKMAALGEMIGNIAHQWRQPLSVISTISTGTKLQKEMGILEDNVLIDNMDQINSTIQFLSKTIDDFRDIVKGEAVIETFKLNDAIDKCLNIELPMLKNNDITLIQELDDSIVLTSYENALIQSLINIINNAKDVLIERNIEKKYIFIETKVVKDKIFIFIKDNAGGIAEDIKERIFEPYFTTKHKSQGTGLGLSMTYNMITKELRGKILIKNVHFKYNETNYTGASFCIVLSSKT